jgi:RNA polymerase sigma factor (TIGR02999 family)
MDEPGITQLLDAWRTGDRTALDRLMPLVYDELKRLAGHHLRREQPGHTLQSTALVNEAYLRLVRGPAVQWENRAHFYGIAARLIRQILVDHARRNGRAKRGGGTGLTLSLDEAISTPDGGRQVDLVRLEDALEALTRLDEQQSRIVELRFFTGLNIEETAEVLGISPRTVKRDWTVARAWLFRELSREDAAS